MILSDNELLKEIENGLVQGEGYKVGSASVDLTLHERILIPDSCLYNGWAVDSRKPELSYREESCKPSGIIPPGGCWLASTEQMVCIPAHLAAQVTGRSSIGRLFVTVHQTAGFIDPGFPGEITLEIKNEGSFPVRLYAGDRICQLKVHRLTSPAAKPYSKGYSGQRGGPKASKGLA